MNENSFNANQRIEMINDMISKTRKNVGSNSFAFIFWGVLVASVSLLNYTLIHLYSISGEQIGMVWSIASVVGMVVMFTYYKVSKSKENYVTYYSTFLRNLWIVIGISFFISTFLSVYQQVPPYSYNLLLAGIGTLITGWTLRLTSLIIGGIALMVASVVYTFIPSIHGELFYGIAILIGYVIPGVILKSSESK